MASKKPCLYCGSSSTLTREHVVPEALGGRLWTKSVCAKCNNEELSRLDEELTSRSPLSLVAAQEMHKTAGYTWDVDHSEGNLLIEAHQNVPPQSPTVWPQMIFEEKGEQLRADAEEINEFGADNFRRVFVQRLLRAFQTLGTTRRPRLVFERVAEKIPAMYRYPPRVFATRRIWDFDNRMHFQCRYLRADDRREVLRRLGNLDPHARFELADIRLGSSRPAFHLRYEAVAVLRSLVKMGINLLRWKDVCTETEVDRDHFPAAVRLVTGEQAVSNRAFKNTGFVYADDLRPLECPKDHHKFRLQYDRGIWRIWFAFFSGRIGAFVRFPGPSRESWCTADVRVPIGSRDWSVHKSPILQPICVRIEWKELQKVIPSVPMENTRAEMTVTEQS